MRNPLLIALSLGVASCAGASGVRPDSSPDAGHGRLITAEDVQATGASNIWEALKYTVRSHYFSDYKGQPTGVSSNRGRGSIVLREEPLIVLDGAQLADVSLLRHIPAIQVRSIRVLSGSDGMTYYGTNSTGGVIVIETMLRKRI